MKTDWFTINGIDIEDHITHYRVNVIVFIIFMLKDYKETYRHGRIQDLAHVSARGVRGHAPTGKIETIM